MNSNWKRLRPVLASLVLFAGGWPAVGDELKYLPDDTKAIVSCDTEKASSIVKEAMSTTPENARAKWLKFAGRFTLAFTGNDEILIVTTAKPITLADLKSLHNELYQTEKGKHTTKETKYGEHTILQNEFDNINIGPASFLAEGKYVVMGPMPILKKIIDRNNAKKPPPTNLKAGLDIAGFDNGANLVFDVKSVSESNRKDVFDALAGLPRIKDIKASFPNVRHLAMKLNEKDGKISMSAILICDNEKNAAILKSIAEDTAKYIPKHLTDIKPDAMFSKKDMEMKRQSLVTLFKSAKASSNGNQVIAHFEAPTDIVISAARGIDLLALIAAFPAPEKDR